MLRTAAALTSLVVPLGHSVHSRPIVAYEVGSQDAPKTMLVVGCIHGNEPAGIAIAAALEHVRPPRGIALWIVPDLNPDGVAAGTRHNADDVDLNRNFPTGWRAQTGVYDSGPKPLSEPESRIAYRLVLRIRPRVSIWFHQHLDVVDASTGDPTLLRRFATVAGERLVPLPRYGGSAVTWENARFPGTTPFVVELPAGSLTRAAVQRYVRAVLTVASLVAAA